MERKGKLKEIDIKNCTCYYFDDIMRAWDIDIYTDFGGILLDEKVYRKKQKYFNLRHFLKNFKESKTTAY